MDVLIINEHDYTGCIEMSGYTWSRNDIDSDSTTRLKDGNMRRKKLTTKRKLQYKTLPGVPMETLAQLDDDLSLETFTAQYHDLHGAQTRTFYCSSFTAVMDWVDGDTSMWSGAEFAIVEV